MQENNEIEKKILEIEEEMNAPDFWVDKSRAQERIRELQELKDRREGLDKYDRGGATISIVAGAGGDDSEDFASMLLRMYMRYAEKAKMEFRLIHENENDHGGYRNITFELLGRGVYGKLKHENGVHRLVRISPFNANSKRHTSFVLVEVLPIFDKVLEKEININDDQLKIEFARSSGPGGQNVNKRETAVRIVHIPTNLSAHASGERSQEQNREKAMSMLKAKIFKKAEMERKSIEESMKISGNKEIEWGSQIRSYVLHPYKMVKDHRTGAETAKVDDVLDGDIELFLEAEKSLGK